MYLTKEKNMFKQDIEFYNPINLKTYNLDQAMRYQLNMLENLDPFTKKHSENVANLTCRMCEYLHTKKSFTIHATICAYLHDIGKLFIPPEILNKPTQLTEEEFEIMKTHTTIGYNMCNILSFRNNCIIHICNMNNLCIIRNFFFSYAVRVTRTI